MCVCVLALPLSHSHNTDSCIRYDEALSDTAATCLPWKEMLMSAFCNMSVELLKSFQDDE